MKRKTFAVELRRMSYVTFYVEADDAEQAEQLAWEELEVFIRTYVTFYVEADDAEQAEQLAWEELEKHADSLSIEDASWDVESIEEEK